MPETTTVVGARVGKDERRMIERAAAEAEVTLSRWCRITLARAAAEALEREDGEGAGEGAGDAPTTDTTD